MLNLYACLAMSQQAFSKPYVVNLIPKDTHLVIYMYGQTTRGITITYTTLTNFNTKYLVMCKVYTDVGGIEQLYHDCPHVRNIIHSLKLVDYLHVQADNPWYNYYMYF